MRSRLLSTFAILAAAACSKGTPSRPTTPSAPLAQPAAGQMPAGETVSGKILEKIDASSYSYLRLQTAAGEAWAAVPKTDKAVGADVTLVGVAWMQNFKSPTMKRTWDRIAFGSLAGETEGAPAGDLPAGHPNVGAAQAGGMGGGMGMFAQQAADSGGAAGHTKAPEGDDVKVAKASGATARTIAEVRAQKSALKDKQVAVRGKVVKATNGVLGKNWIHVRDGSAQGDAGDLTVATADTAKVGDTVLVTGTVHLDRDLGAGYHYDVLVEDAQVKAQ